MTPPIPDDISDRLLAECLGHPQAYDQLGWLCDNVGGRTSGADSGKRAEEWAFDLFTCWGLENVHYEELPVTAWLRGTISVRALEPAPWTLIALAHGNAPAHADVTAPVLDLGHADRPDFERLKSEVVGKIALCDEGVAPGRRALHRSEKLLMAAQYGAAGLMIYSSAPGGLPRTGVCTHGESPIPSLGISQEDGKRLLRLLQGGATPIVQITMTNQFQPGTARNVLADLPGTEFPDEIVLAGGHLDSWDISQGATDNGLGTAIVLEMAHALAAVGKRPCRTLRFAIWAAEEIGLCGSWDYAKRHADLLANFAGVMNFDMTGTPYGFWTPGVKEPHPMLKDLTKKLAGLGMREEFSHKAGLHSDHMPFMLAGVPVVGLMAKLEGEGAYYYHSVGDTFEKVSQSGLCRAAAVGAHTLWALADAPERLFPTMSPAEVRTMIDDADLYEALQAEDYDGPPMHVTPKIA